MNRNKFNLILFLTPVILWCDSPSSAQERFVGTFANGVSVELIGIGMNPSADAEWWRPDGSPLVERPYEKLVPKRSFKPQPFQREICFRRTGTLDFEVNRGLRTIPGEFEQSGTPYDLHSQHVQDLEAAIVTFNEKTRMCMVRFIFTYEVSPWATLVEANAGDALGDASPDGKVLVGFMPPRQEGNDTVVSVGFTGFGDTRLLGVDTQGKEVVGKRGEEVFVGETQIVDYRFANKSIEDIKKWRFQKRRLATNKIEFHNVALDPGTETDVKIDVVSAKAENRANRMARQQELVQKLAGEHVYNLADGEPLKYVPDADSETRNALHYLIQNEQKWATPPAEYPFETYMLVFHEDSNGKLNWVTSREDAPTLANVLDRVLGLRKQQYEGPADVLSAYIPGDWILTWDARDAHELTKAELATFEKILNEQLNLGVKVAWRIVEKPALVITGKYRANPQSEEGVFPSSTTDGSFGLIARRSYLAGTGGSYEQFKAAIGEALILPVVDEAEVRPKNNGFLWLQSGEPIMNSDRLPPEQERLVIESLHAQLGYDFKIEPRKVKVLSIEAVNE
jgi:hypothetical protein